jgi:hypothetical protein
MEKDPALAARLAEQSLALGLIDWNYFLLVLNERNTGEAERLGAVLIDRLRDSSPPPGYWSNMSQFFLGQERSANLKEHFLQALAIRLRRDLRPDLARWQLEDDLRVTQYMISAAAKYSPRLQPEFERLALEFQQLFNSLALPLPGPQKSIAIDGPPSSAAAVPGNTNELRDALTPVDKIFDVQVRDQKYQKLAVDAALKADLKLAEDMLWRISNEDLRREATIEVYSPLVRKALGEADWEEAQRLALKVLDPLGRTLILDELGQRMLQAKQKKARVLEVYRAAAAHLEGDQPTSNVARAWLLLLRSLFMLDPENGLDPASGAIMPLNKLVSTGELFKEVTFSQSLSTWVKFTSYSFSAGEVLYLPEMLSKAFGEMARQDEDRALKVAADLTLSLRSLAQIAVSREILKKVEQATKALPKNAKSP